MNFSAWTEHTPVPWYVAFPICIQAGKITTQCESICRTDRTKFIELELTGRNIKYTAAAKSNALDSASKALASLNQVLKSDPKLGVILHAPTLSSKDKAGIIAELEKHTGGQDKAKIVVNFMETLAENNRLGLLQGICEKFGQLMGASRGEMDLVITSAQV